MLKKYWYVWVLIAVAIALFAWWYFSSKKKTPATLTPEEKLKANELLARRGVLMGEIAVLQTKIDNSPFGSVNDEIELSIKQNELNLVNGQLANYGY